MKKVKFERLRRNWTQVDLAFRSRIGVAEISKIETGRLVPYPSHIRRLAEAFGIDESELLGDDACREQSESDDLAVNGGMVPRRYTQQKEH